MNGPWPDSAIGPGTIRSLPHDSTMTAVRLWREARRGKSAMAASVPESACSRRVRGEPGAGNEKAVRMLLDDRRGAQSGKMS